MVKVSIIVPVYNVEKYLDRCLNSLVNQTLSDIQIIIVNDGSPDGSQTIIDRFVSEYPDKVEAYRKENGGLSSARNYGINFAKGEYIGFVDSDDYVHPSMFEKLYEACKKNDSEVSVCGYLGINEKTNHKKTVRPGKELFGKRVSESPEMLCRVEPYAWNKLYNRNFFINSGLLYPEGKVFEDIPVTYPLLAQANKISSVNEPLYYYIQEREGAITNSFGENLFQLFDSMQIANNRMKIVSDDEKINEIIVFINIKHVLIRFYEFKKYKNKKLQKRILNEGFEFLNENFPGWKKNKLVSKYFLKGNKIKVWLLKQKWVWQIRNILGK